MEVIPALRTMEGGVSPTLVYLPVPPGDTLTLLYVPFVGPSCPSCPVDTSAVGNTRGWDVTVLHF